MQKMWGDDRRMTPRLKDTYIKEVVPEMMKQFSYKNKLQAPRLEKIVINTSVSDATQNIKILDQVVLDVTSIAGQKPLITRAKKSISAFKLRQGMPIGCKVTLRGSRMYEFYDRLVNAALPRTRDFKGINVKSFDGRGNFTLGIREYTIFPEIIMEKVDKLRGLDIIFVTTARTDGEAKVLLKLLGMPFREI